MKKTLLIIVALIVASLAVQAGSSPEDEAAKKFEKMKKEKLKEMKKQGWTLYLSSQNIETALDNHYETLRKLALDGHEIVGVGAGKNKNLALNKAKANARMQYAQETETEIKGIISEKTGITDAKEIDDFYTSAVSHFETKIAGELNETMKLIRDTKDGGFEVCIYYVVSEEYARQKRVEAAQAMMNEMRDLKRYDDRMKELK